MIDLIVLKPFALAAIAGIVYGISFLLQHRALLWGTSLQASRAQAVGFFLLRILILWALGTYLLRIPTIHFILATILFFGAFWLTILFAKATSHERN